MRQAITTKFYGPTNTRGSRIKAIARKADGWGKEMSHTQDYQYRGTEEEHTLAAKACAEKYGWAGLWVGGGNADNTGYVYVNIGRRDEETIAAMRCCGCALGLEGRDWFYVSPPQVEG